MDFSTFSKPLYFGGLANKITPVINCFFRINPETKRKLMMRIKLITILLFAACLHLSASSFSQSISISEKNASLESVLNKIEQQSGYDVFLQTELLNKSTKVSIDVKNTPMDKVLDKVFKNQPFTYAIVGHTIVLKEKTTVKTVTAITSAIAASIVTGKVVDADTKEPLVGASVLLKGTTKATSTGLDGSFKLDVSDATNPVIVFSYIGYVSKEVEVADKTKLGEIGLKSSATGMSEVVVNGDVAIDRKTPVAVTSIGPQFIAEHIGAQDIPQLLSGIPGVMVTAQGGGYGDSRISIRGFSSKSGNGNVAFTINGIPVNDPETGAIYWSDFSGITDVASSIQVQRGLGASKIIIPSFGGTVNITTRSTDMQQGGYISQTIGSDGYEKTAILISTGLNSNGWAATFQGSKNSGNGFADGLSFLGYNYFGNISKVLSPNQTLSLNIIGASQTHGQRAEESIADYQQAPQGIKWNYYDGVKNGQEYNPYNNFFSEPLISINHDWTINSKSSLSTVVYGLFGNGGGGDIAGSVPVANLPRVGNFYTPIDFDAVQRTNAASADGSASTYIDDSHDQTNWYGLRSTYRTILGKYIDLSVGIDLRYYVGNHYDEVHDLLGADYVQYNYSGNPALGTASGDINNPVYNAVVGSKIDYYNRDYVESGGAFAQAEYSKNNFTAFATLSGSEDADKRTDFFNYLNSDPNQTSRWVNYTTYQAKTGANYNINSQMNVFANIGYLTKPPYFGNVFENYTNQINKSAITEKLFSYELGYGFKTSDFSAKVNLYRTQYSDRAFASSYSDPTTEQLYTANVSGVGELHQGAELELKYRPIKEISVGGMLSLGDWYYTSNAGPVSVQNNQGAVVGTVKQIYLKNEKVGDAAQTTAAAFADFNVLPQVKLGVIYNFYGNYTSYVPFQTYTSANLQPYKIPDYSLWSVNGVFKFKMAGFDSELIATVNNLLNTKYISDSEDYGGTGQASNASVYYGLGRVFTTGLKVKF
ncbi:TonB-dependent receptor domain-containing protein [Mucilaginibacter sp. X4EP1]|uniref:TonB-dependent receptor domain-containing protein n=1 Tax=Mucilaginibacter sp. X4EP1 TaxID=2723092 RepID=UPI00216A90F5|nr:TonB-dependent receptor [Mucilaginibacter sp. X4EP1]MCS3816591.1 outer membrane cobalamin receptor [Mucilaginibacter sp. X4EP1]